MIDELTKKLIEDSRAVLEGKKLDPVGQRDADVDNDGDVDDSDEYLGKRRDAIAKAMKKEGNKFTRRLTPRRPIPPCLSPWRPARPIVLRIRQRRHRSQNH